ncbi:Putative L,D-transpeptidase YkuD [Anaerohalosphaera lusitana]|uniref:Putative L,D-transpeptidase YkuD n=1 Tax=Anaerohalosphaera lusitana TaxID=1936003 RepID=A0A1U9NL14_9BACT|nr:L,D-transpeptidase family protein [Anaerohalosphaera lusitana]AQT68418.1 Putative L,D-transpeptidase YkuD [Anaerohalosphaera lusitana]
MARRRRKYPKYRSRYSSYGRRAAQRKQRRLMVLGVLVIAAVFLFFKFRGDDEQPEVVGVDDSIINDINPDFGEDTSSANTSAESSNKPSPEPASDPVSETQTKPEVVTQPKVEAPKPEPVEVVEKKETVKDKVASEPAAKELTAKAVQDMRAGKTIAARDKLNEVLDMKLSDSDREKVKAALADLAERWLFSPEVLPGDELSEYYLVQRGDYLSEIGKRYKVPYQLIMKINGIPSANRLRAGQKIKVVKGPFNVAIFKSDFTMDLYLQRTYVKSYEVGLGSMEHETPSGKWRVEPNDKLKRPNWTDPDTGETFIASDPEYPIGERWIGIEGIEDKTRDKTGFAIHGTNEPESIGKRASRGCIRLKNTDVIEVYNMLYTGDSLVYIYD